MANRNLFKSAAPVTAKLATTRNKAGGLAYNFSDAEKLCQYAVTSTFNDVFYASGKEQLDEVKALVNKVEPQLVAKAAVYGHENGRLKDIPAYLLAVLAAKGELELFDKVFDRVVTSPKMLLNFVQIVRSGVTGRKSFGSAVKKRIQNWITKRRGNKLFLASIGYSDPSLADVIKMVHPRPADSEQDHLFGYLLDKEYEFEFLPPLVQEFELFKQDQSNALPDMDYRALTNFKLSKDHWKQIASNMPWNTLRMNLNVLERNGVFNDKELTEKVAAKLSNKEEIKKWNAFPYQLLTTFQNVGSVPMKVQLALQDALETATNNVPKLGDSVAVCVDVSGSMSMPITGNRDSVASKTRAIDVAALIAASLARTNPETLVVSFGSTSRVVTNFNPRDSVVTNANKLALEGNIVGHATNASAAMDVLLKSHRKLDFVVFVGDSQSWVDSRYSYGATPLMEKWALLKKRNKNAKLAEINVQAYGNSQADCSDKSVMNIGGFSDAVFDVLKEFAGRNDNVSFSKVVDKVVTL